MSIAEKRAALTVYALAERNRHRGDFIKYTQDSYYAPTSVDIDTFYEYGYVDCRLVDFIRDIQRDMPSVVKELARIEIEGGENFTKVRVYYTRTETDEEIEARLDEEIRSIQTEESNERQLLAKLLVRYGER